MSTKELILDAALDLFSKNGFEATSTGQIADAVGIRKSSLYNHFKNKQDILDTLIDAASAKFDEVSVTNISEKNTEKLNADMIIAQIRGQIYLLLHNETVSKVRRLLTIEQYRNPVISEIQTKRVYTNVLSFNERLIQNLIKESVLIDGDVEIMAAQLAFPVSAWVSLCEREPEREEEITALVERHVRQFFAVYSK